MKPKALVVNGLGIGCHEECAHAYNVAGADAEIVHINDLFSGRKNLSDFKILNLSGGFLHGDTLGSGMCAANQLEHALINVSEDEQKKLKDVLIDFANDGGLIYGQCNGFQLLVKTGLLPGLDNNYSEQTVTLTDNIGGIYRVAPVQHIVEKKKHFAFKGIKDEELILWCRHGEGRIMFYSSDGSIPKQRAKVNEEIVNRRNVLLRYANPETLEPTEEFPFNPNGSVHGIAGLVNNNGRIFAHMAHPEVSVYSSRNPNFFIKKDFLRRFGKKFSEIEQNELLGVGYKIFKNIVDYVKVR